LIGIGAGRDPDSFAIIENDPSVIAGCNQKQLMLFHDADTENPSGREQARRSLPEVAKEATAEVACSLAA
jgi:hypothetical protein